MLQHLGFSFILSASIVCLLSCDGRKPLDQAGPSPAHDPASELKTLVVEPGLKVQLVASDPMIQDPIVLTFDEDGRLWVVEMRGFMPDIDGNGENDPVGRVSVLEDLDGDGEMDRSTVYLDSLVMPRALALVAGGVLVVENKALWLTQDLDHDLKADTKVLLDKDYAGSALPEHSGNGLLRGVDNWYYNVKSRFRYHFKDGAWQRDSTEFRGQWGLSQDDQGRLYYNYNWSQLHADLVPPNYLGRNKHHTPTTGIDHGLTIDRRVYPIRSNPAVNRGYIPGTLDKEGKLVEFTAACSPFYFRGTALPQAYYGNVFVCEPSGNLIKRNVVVEKDLQLSAHDPHPGTEFMASTDERFRPVYLTSGPDGALYVADMYRGLVQHGAYVTPYLRDQTISRKLAAPINRGRIWRIVPQNWTPSKATKLSALATADLIPYLSNADGWYRDMAQRLLVERKDVSISHALKEVVINGENAQGRFRALWTLDGLGLTEPPLLFNLLSDPQELIRTSALRLLEPFALTDKSVQTALAEKMRQRVTEATAKETLQLALTAGVLEPAKVYPLLAVIVQRYDTSALIRDAVMSSLENHEFEFLKVLTRSPGWKAHTPPKEIFLEILTTAVVKKRDASELAALLDIIDGDQQHADWMKSTILTGIAIQGNNRKMKPVQLAAAPKVLTGKTTALDANRLLALESMFEWPGHKVPAADQQKQATLTEADQKQFALGRQHYLTTCAGCHGTDGAGLSRFAPPLVGSDWVLGNEKRLALLILQGIEGPIDVAGKKYDAPDILPVMPSHSTMDDGAIMAVMTYIRNEWGNSAPAVGSRVVGKTRHTSQGRVIPWTAAELNKHIQESPDISDLK